MKKLLIIVALVLCTLTTFGQQQKDTVSYMKFTLTNTTMQQFYSFDFGQGNDKDKTKALLAEIYENKVPKFISDVFVLNYLVNHHYKLINSFGTATINEQYYIYLFQKSK